MLAKVIEWSIQNKLMILLASVFLTLGGIYSIQRIPVDAIPDLSDVQVIIYTEYPGQAPQIVEDQVTYLLTTEMLSVPHSKVVRGYSFFGFSFVYIIFEDGTDLYWARSRVLEYLNSVSKRLPDGVTPTLGPDATGVGWAFMYVLRSDRHDLSQLRSIQDWYLKYELTAVPGVSEVAGVGGFVRQYQITVDPNKLRVYAMPVSKIRRAVQRSNSDAGGRLLEVSEKEFMIRGLGYLRSLEDIRQIALGVGNDGIPILLRDVATVAVGPEMRRGLAEWNGEGETVGGIVVVRHGADAYQVIQDVKAELERLKPGLPEGVRIEVAYDRSALIERAVFSLEKSLTQQLVIVGLVSLVFLAHVRSGLVAVMTLPVGILTAFIVLHLQGLSVNIMSLGGIAVAIGTMVDSGIVLVDSAHRHLLREAGKKPHWQIVADACKEVGPSLFFSLLVITVSFIPVFTLEAQEGRLFKPLAFTKTYAMAAAAVLSVTLVPVLVGYWIRGRILPEYKNPINRWLTAFYRPLLAFVFRFKWLVLALVVLLMAISLLTFFQLGSEFMPPLWEGDLLYMPTTLPGISITKAREILQQTDRIIKSFPEVDRVFGKAGRADTATDPAPLSMIETTIVLKPEDQWREGMTKDKLIEEMNTAIQVPGLTNAWTMPIKTRIDMLSTGIRTPVGIKIAGSDLTELERLGKEVEHVVREVPGTRSVYAERVMGGHYLDYKIDRKAIARYGLGVGEIQEVIQSAVGGMNITTTVEGVERYPVNLRYSRELRHNLPAIRAILVTAPTGQQIPLGQLGRFSYVTGPAGIKSENAKPNAWIYVDIRNVDVGTYVKQAQEQVARRVEIPPGYSIGWSGQFEYMERAQQQLMLIVPLTLVIIFVIIYVNTGSLMETGMVLAGVPFALTGSVGLLYLLDYNLSVAVWVGFIALAGLYAETAIVFLLYLRVSYRNFLEQASPKDRKGLIQAIGDGSVRRLRPILMTIATDVIGLIPIMWSQGTGSEVMKRIAAPLVGGVITSGMVVLLVYPLIYYLWKSRRMPKGKPFTAPQPLKEGS